MCLWALLFLLSLTIRSVDSQAMAQCGNGALDVPQETCDDGNVRNGDGCSGACQVEVGCVCSGTMGQRSACDCASGQSNLMWILLALVLFGLCLIIPLIMWACSGGGYGSWRSAQKFKSNTMVSTVLTKLFGERPVKVDTATHGPTTEPTVVVALKDGEPTFYSPARCRKELNSPTALPTAIAGTKTPRAADANKSPPKPIRTPATFTAPTATITNPATVQRGTASPVAEKAEEKS